MPLMETKSEPQTRIARAIVKPQFGPIVIRGTPLLFGQKHLMFPIHCGATIVVSFWAWKPRASSSSSSVVTLIELVDWSVSLI